LRAKKTVTGPPRFSPTADVKKAHSTHFEVRRLAAVLLSAKKL
jgi:hypothetical protein